LFSTAFHSKVSQSIITASGLYKSIAADTKSTLNQDGALSNTDISAHHSINFSYLFIAFS